MVNSTLTSPLVSPWKVLYNRESKVAVYVQTHVELQIAVRDFHPHLKYSKSSPETVCDMCTALATPFYQSRWSAINSYHIYYKVEIPSRYFWLVGIGSTALQLSILTIN